MTRSKRLACFPMAEQGFYGFIKSFILIKKIRESEGIQSSQCCSGIGKSRLLPSAKFVGITTLSAIVMLTFQKMSKRFS